MAVKAQTAGTAAFNFGDLGVYVAGGGIPDGKYALEFTVQMEPSTEKYQPKVPRLGIMIAAHPLEGGDPKTKFLSLGSKAHESFVPNPDTGKGIVPIAGGPGSQSLPSSTNWGIFLKSLYDCGLPQGVFTNDISVLDGVHVHLVAQPEPEERKGFRQRAAKTSEVEQGEDTGPKGGGTIPVVTEILEGGAPWEGGGGIPEAEPEKKPATAAKSVAGKTAAGKTPPANKPAAKPAAGPTEEELMDAAVSGMTAVLEKNPDGCSKLALRTGTFKSVSESANADVANAVLETFFSSDDDINGVLDQLGYELKGQKVVLKG